MPDRPDARELLTTARDTLLAELLPRLPADAHYAARMIANAMAIAEREAGAADPDATLAADLAAIDGAPADATTLAARLRAGADAGDAAWQAAVHAALLRWTRARLAIANPRALGAAP